MTTQAFSTVYGPVRSWRYGRSLGIDPIGTVSTCSFNCVYCQLGCIEHLTPTRSVYVPTARIVDDLRAVDREGVDIVTLSGSGEPTLALNVGEILQAVRDEIRRPSLVLTNGTLLGDAAVIQGLAAADRVAVKLDAWTDAALRRINRPVAGLTAAALWAGICRFRQAYPGQFELQTMVLRPWSEQERADYIAKLQHLQPTVVYLNTPSRPKPRERSLAGRGNEGGDRTPAQQFHCVDSETLTTLAQTLTAATQIPVRWKSP
ncbi:radical SAM protein [Spirulina major CS-329]|uniref:radical SAM protein n=1 Tax=Spirulina TaxID=1154 RepID=UPI0023312A37|nr:MULTISPECIES: radical SAM protein [Spirulina]MDB9496977.1 radical SAM protein [Spirulina subsalsa CS-330]MDB9504416.1 radical SAM protein [Spirulina major CS-329]